MRPRRRLSGLEALLLASDDARVPELSIGDRVRVYFSAQDPIEATVVSEIDRSRFVEVEQDFHGSPVRFPVLSTCCVKLPKEDECLNGE